MDRRLSRGDSNGVATAAAATASAATAVFADKRQTILNMARPFANSHPRRSGATVRIGPAIAEDCKRLLRVALGVARYGPCEFSCRHKPLGRPQAAWSRRGLRDDEILRRRDRNGRGFALGHAADVGQVACGLLLVECVGNRVCARPRSGCAELSRTSTAVTKKRPGSGWKGSGSGISASTPPKRKGENGDGCHNTVSRQPSSHR